MCMGKIKLVFDLVCYWYEKGDIIGILVFVLNGVYVNWVCC